MSEVQRFRGLGRSCLLLIAIAGMERFVYKGVASNLVTYLTDVMKMSNSSAAKTVNAWSGFTSILPLFVAPLVDSYWDRYPSILTSGFLYFVGLVALTLTALAKQWSPTNTTSSSFLLWSLYLISLGQGGYNPSLQAFGADQLDSRYELPCSKEDNKSNKKSAFFQWWYFGVCTGSLLGVTFMSYIQDSFGWVLGFAIPTIAMLLSLALFSGGTRIYTYKNNDQIDTKRFKNIIETIKATASKLMGSRNQLQDEQSQSRELELHGEPLFREALDGTDQSLDKNASNGFYIPDKVRVVLRLLPIWTMLLMFAVIFQQPATFFTKQGMTMRRNIGSNFKIPPATLQSAITVSIILLMPLYDKVLIPITQFFTRNKKGITVMQRMGVGMVLSIIAMAIAALVETKRLEISKRIEIDGVVPLSIFWLLPQYILLGISDIFTVVGMQEFFYSEVPINMRTMAFAMYNSVFGVGSFLSAFMISVIEVSTTGDGRQSWFSDNMDEARLNNYYWFLAFGSSLSLLLYVILCRCYRSSSLI